MVGNFIINQVGNMEQLELFARPYVSIASDSMLTPLKTPSIGFDINCPRDLVNRVLRAMSTGLITVKDYQGNELKVKVY